MYNSFHKKFVISNNNKTTTSVMVWLSIVWQRCLNATEPLDDLFSQYFSFSVSVEKDRCR